MAHHRLGHPEEARQWLDKALARADGEISAAKGSQPLLWDDKLTLQLLRREAMAELGLSAASKANEPATKPGQ
jgi:hypothetical protein